MREENNKLFVGNLTYDIDDAKLLEIFSSLPEVEVVEARVVMDRFSGKSRGFGFVTVATPEMAEKAIELTNNTEVGGRTIFVNIARPQTDRPTGDRNGSRDSRSSGGNRFGGRR